MRLRRIAPVLMWLAVIVALSSSPSPPNPVEGRGFASLGHLVEYAILAALLARSAQLVFPGRSSVAVVGTVWILAVLLGVADEWYQSHIPNRDVDPVDVLFDATGAALGLLFWYGATAIEAFRARRAQRPLATG